MKKKAFQAYDGVQTYKNEWWLYINSIFKLSIINCIEFVIYLIYYLPRIDMLTQNILDSFVLHQYSFTSIFIEFLYILVAF